MNGASPPANPVWIASSTLIMTPDTDAVPSSALWPRMENVSTRKKISDMNSDPKKPLATRVVDEMMNGDAFSQWLKIERMEEGSGHCTLRMTVRDEMVNGFFIAHGGISYALADSALAFASNGHGIKPYPLKHRFHTCVLSR